MYNCGLHFNFVPGNFWLSATVEAILRADELDNFVNNGYEMQILPIEFTEGYKHHLTSTRPRLIRTHMRPNYLPKNLWKSKAKIINIIRNPRDVAVSFYNFAKINTVYEYEGSWDTFFEAFMAGHVAWGGWYDYMTSWLKHEKEPNLMFISYEEFVKDPQTVIQRIATFIGKPLEKVKVERISDILSFKSMKSNPKLDVRHETIKGDFLRKGTVGDWSNYFTERQIQVMEKMCTKFKDETEMELVFK